MFCTEMVSTVYICDVCQKEMRYTTRQSAIKHERTPIRENDSIVGLILENKRDGGVNFFRRAGVTEDHERIYRQTRFRQDFFDSDEYKEGQVCMAVDGLVVEKYIINFLRERELKTLSKKKYETVLKKMSEYLKEHYSDITPKREFKPSEQK